ncbi:Crp/Fnr family transcriptional regulator [Apibacter sp. HY039]|uniref:Crp/Fnr family transcriptional regulator n=1 Tax=Apibacter sp. HY039 TaxID=2501476 RepID=UPI0013E32309|nr:Crp/Fnr family transcriptional regulator [Apibacter sp. HY039]
MYSELIQHIENYVLLTNEDKNKLTNYFTYQKINKKEYLLKQGDKCQYNYFIISGVCRMYTFTEEGKEQTIQFAIENWWITDYDSFGKDKSSVYYIQALENAEVLKINRKKLDELLEDIPKLEKYFRMLLERAFAAAMHRIYLILTTPKKELFLTFVQSYPQFVQRVSQKILSTFLGLTPEYVSEIRKGSIS